MLDPYIFNANGRVEGLHQNSRKQTVTIWLNILKSEWRQNTHLDLSGYSAAKGSFITSQLE